MGVFAHPLGSPKGLTPGREFQPPSPVGRSRTWAKVPWSEAPCLERSRPDMEAVPRPGASLPRVNHSRPDAFQLELAWHHRFSPCRSVPGPEPAPFASSRTSLSGTGSQPRLLSESWARPPGHEPSPGARAPHPVTAVPHGTQGWSEACAGGGGGADFTQPGPVIANLPLHLAPI